MLFICKMIEGISLGRKVPQYFLAERLRINLDLKVASKRLEGKVLMQTPTTEKLLRVLHQCLM